MTAENNLTEEEMNDLDSFITEQAARIEAGQVEEAMASVEAKLDTLAPSRAEALSAELLKRLDMSHSQVMSEYYDLGLDRLFPATDNLKDFEQALGQELLKAIREYETGEQIIHWEQMRAVFPDDRPWTPDEEQKADDASHWFAAVVLHLVLEGQNVAADQLHAQLQHNCSRLFEIVSRRVTVAMKKIESSQKPEQKPQEPT